MNPITRFSVQDWRLEMTRRRSPCANDTVDSLASRWLFATPDGRIVRCDIDPRPGGPFVITHLRAGDEIEHRGAHVDVDPPRRLVFAFSVPKYSSVVTPVKIGNVPEGTGCELTLVHEGVLAEWACQTELGWRDSLTRLAQVVGG